MSQTPSYTLIYFSPRGRPEPVRLMLHYAGIPFEDRHVRDTWMSLKPTTPLGQLPILVEHGPDGDTSYPQTMAFLRHLARVHGLAGRDEAETFASDIAAEAASDVRQSLTSLRFSPGWTDEAARAKFAAETVPLGLGRLSKLLGDRQFFGGGAAPTFGDFVAFDAIDGMVGQWPDCADAFPNLQAFAERMRALPGLAAYLAARG